MLHLSDLDVLSNSYTQYKALDSINTHKFALSRCSHIQINSELKQKFSGEVESDISTLAHSQIDIDFISKVKEVIEHAISNPELSDKYLCDEMAMSSSQLYKKIKQLTDLSPKEFVRILRLKESVKLLKTKKHNVSEVANMVGFNDPLYFSKCFKNQFGDSPSKYIK